MRSRGASRYLAIGFAVVLAGVLAPPAGAVPTDLDISWSPGTPQPHQTVRFSASDEGGRWTAWVWDIDNDGNFDDDAGQRINVKYREPGDYRIAVRATNDLLEVKEGTGIVRVRYPPVRPQASFVFFPAAPIAGESVTFVSTSTDPDSVMPSSALRWDLNGDGKFDDATGASTSVSFPLPGNYPIALQVRTNAADVASVVVAVGASAAGVQAQRATYPLMSPFPVVRIAGRTSRRGARIRRLTINAPPGASVSVRCRGRGCPFKQAKQTVSTRVRAGRGLPLTRITHIRRLEGRTLRTGAILKVMVTRPDAVGKYTRFRIRKTGPPLRSDHCVVPFTTQPVPCPAR